MLGWSPMAAKSGMTGGAIALVLLMAALASADGSLVVQSQLPNGLTVVIQADHRLPRVGVAVTYAVGRRDDPRGLEGLAHIVEHALADASTHVPGGTVQHLEALGGVASAMTTPDFTTMYEELPREYWETGLWLESDRMAFMLSALDTKRLERIRAVVKREWEERIGKVDRSAAAIVSSLYAGNHPYARLVDDASGLDVFTLDQVRWFFQRRYGPASAVLAIVGDVDPTLVDAAVRKYFGSIRGSSAFVRRAQTPPHWPDEQLAAREHSIDPGLDRNWRWERLDLAWQTPAAYAPGDAELDIVALMLQERLRKRLLNDGTVFAVGVQHPSRQLGSPFTIRLEVSPQHSLDGILSSVMAEVSRLRSASAEFEPARRRQVIRGLRELDNLAWRAYRLAESACSGTLHMVEDDVERYGSLGDKDVARAVLTYLLPGPHVVVRSQFSRFASQPRSIDR
jgi:zinc protease